MPIRSIAFLLYFLGSSTVALAFPMVGVLCYIVLYHVYPQATWWGKALQPLGIRYAFVCGLCLIAGTVLNLNRLKFGRRFVHPVEWGIVLVFATMLLSIVTGLPWHPNRDFIIDKMSKVFLFALVLSHVAVTRRQVWYVVVLFALMTLYLGNEARNAPSGAFINNRLDGIGGPDFRASTGLAIHLFALLPFVAIVLRQKALWLRVMGFFAACYGLNAILLCRTRSAFVAGVVAGVCAIWYVPRRHRYWVTAVLVLATAGGVVLSDEWFRERMLTILSSPEERDKSAASRLEIWAASWEMFKEYPMGVGIGQFEQKISAYLAPGVKSNPDAHNTYVLCAGETGFLGLAAFLLTLGAGWYTLAKLSRRVKAKLPNPDQLELMIYASRLSLIVYMVGGIFTSRFYTEGMWMLIMLPACLARAVENELRVEAREEAKLGSLLTELGKQGNLLPAT